MKKLFYLFSIICIAILSVATQSYAEEVGDSPVKGVNLQKSSSYGLKSQIRIDDSILDNGGVRSKNFTMSVRVWIDKISEGELNYTNIPLFGINQTNYYGVTTMADVILENGAYNISANWDSAGVGLSGDQHSKANACMEEWVWLVLVVNDEEGWAKLYCDGEETSNLDYSSKGRIFRDGEDAVFHCTNSKSYASLSLRYDDLKIVNKVLGAEEISELYYAYVPGAVPDYINGYYSFDENTGTVNEYPNIVGGNVMACVVEGSPDYAGSSYVPNLSGTDAMCDGWSPIFEDKETFVVNVTTEGEGNVVLKDYNGNEFESGSAFMKDSTVYVVATPADDYILSEISVGGVKQENLEEVSFRITGNTEVKVVFVLKGALVNIADENLKGGSYVCVNPDTEEEYPKDATGKYYSIPYNSEVKVKATAYEGYRLSSISVVSAGGIQELEVGNPVFIIENDEYEIKVVFVARYSVNFWVEGEGGEISVKVDGKDAVSGKIYDEGAEIEVSVLPEEEYKLESLSVNGSYVDVIDNVYVMSLNDNVDIIAAFTDLSGLNAVSDSGVYYDSFSGILYTNTMSVIKVYSLNGSLLTEVFSDSIDMNTISDNECIVVVSADGKSNSFKIIK